MPWIFNATRQIKVVPLKVADHFFSRLQGLLGAKANHPVPALLITHCSCIHTLGMSVDIDVLFLDKTLKVTKIFLKVSPMKFKVHAEDSSSVLEIISGRWDYSLIRVGDQLSIVSD